MDCLLNTLPPVSRTLSRPSSALEVPWWYSESDSFLTSHSPILSIKVVNCLPTSRWIFLAVTSTWNRNLWLFPILGQTVGIQRLVSSPFSSLKYIVSSLNFKPLTFVFSLIYYIHTWKIKVRLNFFHPPTHFFHELMNCLHSDQIDWSKDGLFIFSVENWKRYLSRSDSTIEFISNYQTILHISHYLKGHLICGTW